MNEPIDRRDYGRLEADVEHLKATVDRIEDDLRAMRDMMEQGKGGWKVLVMIGGAVSAVSTFVGYFVHGWVGK
jgi:hypothetical protein